MTRFDRDQFVQDCINARTDTDPMGAVREVLNEAMSSPSDVLRGIGEPCQAGMDILHRSPSLTIFAASWTPRMNLLPHDHDMWALIGIYTGREDNIFWKETEGGLQARGANCLFEGDVATLGKDAIHSVTNPLLRFTGGIHIYGGDYFDAHRHQWDPETLEKEPTNGDRVRAMFAAENERLNI
ncbi:hypothetical protein [Ponticaulis sp.]|uniref:hypothetical protein n=1 Tax=Ponticaulis sp. TaxID=2020902 RepID=UPI000B676C91|nr:hypothetical protein [Ponticaulis sp.]MAI89661.1 hypothetical protein [Ponticaulis sp.]OUY00681.1 MAG: hypothetical protein CBB65_04420 [Hyphomonadaceae bacterium TMED5]|tara:strand:- start:129991 stop:130539 length:549 start_codon:yes stop_codon:yes gene_type:complete